ncbi:uromodulin-like 1 [Astyanax mexicanus]|uniref:Uromodulin-like 1 n=1 Tax=Astyanax mexicanus TaxID=7994 RepID=A0A8B9JZD7_ASTMX|nr:uromodulin-like 1 [Astyanax mexicanus]
MCGIVSAWLVLVVCSLARGHNTLYEGYALSGSSYHLCTGQDSVPVINVVAYQIASSQLRPCGGWLPWKMCNVTVYTTVYKTQVDHIQKEVRRCCDDYEQVGSYCALNLNRSAEFTAKPGVCPHAHPGLSAGPVLGCEWDTDCPGWQKCCQTENSLRCVDPHTQVNISWWLSLNVTVKVSYHLVNSSSGLFNHTRLLHSVVTGALSFPSVSVYHVTSWPAGPVSTVSFMLLGSSEPLSPAETDQRLQVLLENIEEVTSVNINDVDECVTPVLKACPPQSICRNTYGSQNCTCPPGSTDLHPSRPGTNCTFQIVLTSNPVRKPSVDQTPAFTSLSSTSSSTTTSTPISPLTTNGFPSPENSNKTLHAEARLTNINFTDALKDVTSVEYHNLTESIIKEIKESLPSDILDMVNSGKVIVQITRFFQGSVVVKFTLIFLLDSTQNISTVASALMESLQNSTIYLVDKNSTFINDVDECTTGENDCSPWAQCNNTYGSYTCACQPGYTDANHSRPGRICEASLNLTASTSTQPNEASAESSASTNLTTVTADNETHTTTPVSKTTTVMAVPEIERVNLTSSTSPTTSTMLSTASSTALSTASATALSTGVSTASTISATTSTAIPNPLPIISRADAITVECMVGSITVSVAKHYLISHHIPEAALYLGQPQCNVTNTNSTHVQLTADWNKCGLQITENTTVRVTLHSNMTTSVPFILMPFVQLEVPIICVYSHSINVSTGYESSSDVDKINDPVLGSGNFQVTIRLLNGTIPLPQNYTLSPGEQVTIEVAVNSNVSQIKVVINQCWANTNSNPDPPLYIFLKGSCPVSEYATVIQNGVSSKSLLEVNVFSLVNLDIIYLHCQIQICIETASATCRPDCMARSSRAGNVIGMAKASYGPLRRSHQVTLDEVIQGTRAIGFIVLGVGLFVFIVVGVAAFSYYRKKMGNYNFHFRPRPENFTYHVFDT